MLRITSSECTSVATLISLWRHECTRVLADRFTDLKDVAWFNHRVGTNVKEDLGSEVNTFTRLDSTLFD
jgi:dynein heavy chain